MELLSWFFLFVGVSSISIAMNKDGFAVTGVFATLGGIALFGFVKIITNL